MIFIPHRRTEVIARIAIWNTLQANKTGIGSILILPCTLVNYYHLGNHLNFCKIIINFYLPKDTIASFYMQSRGLKVHLIVNLKSKKIYWSTNEIELRCFFMIWMNTMDSKCNNFKVDISYVQKNRKQKMADINHSWLITLYTFKITNFHKN